MRLRPKGPEAEARGYEAEAKILALRPVWPRGFNISEDTFAKLEATSTWQLTSYCNLDTGSGYDLQIIPNSSSIVHFPEAQNFIRSNATPDTMTWFIFRT